ncbi:hypothetical protein ACFS5J_07725 [Flavobacterium chuncheonense]|uniref:Uncharacterized protein n=1 Tax=Flavobacterium chuncheonense TaxID=2026653 RepID=A0ABW5YNC6_9FLAO
MNKIIQNTDFQRLYEKQFGKVVKYISDCKIFWKEVFNYYKRFNEEF